MPPLAVVLSAAHFEVVSNAETLDYWTLIEAQHTNLCHHIYSHTRGLLDTNQIGDAYIRL